MRRTFAILMVLPLTFAFLPLAAVVMGGGSEAPQGTLVLEAADAHGSTAAVNVAAWDAQEFAPRDDALAYRSGDAPGKPGDSCPDAPQS
ncbi:MAG: hypothetical protein WHT63_10605 [Tepidiforma sp.]